MLANETKVPVAVGTRWGAHDVVERRDVVERKGYRYFKWPDLHSMHLGRNGVGAAVIPAGR